MHDLNKFMGFIAGMSFIDLIAGIFYVYLAWRNSAFGKENHARLFGISLLSGVYFILRAITIIVAIYINR